MGVKLQQVTELIEKMASTGLAAGWDNVGLQIGGYNQPVEKVLVTLDINQDVLDKAIDIKADLIISHHPFIFNGLKSITYDTPKGQIIKKAIKNEIALYAAHTNYDIAPGGLNDVLAEKLGIKDTSILNITEHKNLKKLVVFVPEKSLDDLRDALGNAQAGWIGNYSHCSFYQKGTGTFKPLQGTNPHTGTPGKVNRVKEYRLETIVREKDLSKVIKKMLKAHPYEEVAYDIYPVENRGKTLGLGRIGKLEKETTLEKYTKKVKKALDLKTVKVIGEPENKIKKVALCSGSGNDFINSASAKGADLFITGEIKYHDGQNAKDRGLNIIDAGHYGTEKIMQKALTDYLKKQVKENNLDIRIVKNKLNTNPFRVL